MKGWMYFLVLLVGLAGLGVYLFNKPVADVEGSVPDVEVTADQMYREFLEDEAKANLKYRDKIVEVEGSIRAVDHSNEKPIVILNTEDSLFGISCDIISKKNLDVNKGEFVKVKGVCAGMLSDVVMTRCSISRSSK
jgi:hypothetical protein